MEGPKTILCLKRVSLIDKWYTELMLLRSILNKTYLKIVLRVIDISLA